MTRVGMALQSKDQQPCEAAPATGARRSLLATGYRFLVGNCEACLARRRFWLGIGTAAAIARSLLITFPRVSIFTGNDPKYTSGIADNGTAWPAIEAQARDPFSNKLEFYKMP